MSEPGLILQALEQEVRAEVRRRGLVLWLDKDGAYTAYVDRLIARHREGDFPYPVVAFRGSFLELLFQLEDHGNGLDRPHLLIHLPGHTQESVRATPVLELYEPGLPYRKALDTLIRETAHGRVPPEELEGFLSGGSPTLEEADAWLSRQLTLTREGLAGTLEQVGLTVVAESLFGKNPLLASRPLTGPELEVLQAFLHRHTGLQAAWPALFRPASSSSPLEQLAAGFAGWLLCVEYVHDLSRPPHLEELKPLASLAEPLVATCRELARHLREKHPDTYVLLADDTELRLSDELRSIRPEDLGQIDTFRAEEARLLEAAIEALRAGEWEKARAWARARTRETSFWLQRDQLRRFAWTLVGEAAELGDVLARHPRPLHGARGLADAVERYTRTAFEVDRAHRRFEQKRLALIEPRLPHLGDLQEAFATLRRCYRDWADALARDFSALCREHGFLPEDSLQQRSLYEQVVHPLTTGSDKVAFFLIDAFRYELATELLESLESAGTVVDLKARLCELPSLTAVGMNALAPVARNGRLQLASPFQGFRHGEFTVRSPEDRERAMGSRSVEHAVIGLKLAEVCEADSAALARKVGRSRLIVVHSQEIDDAGEASLGLATFELTLRQIKAAWHHLQAAGVKQFVFTADHGFLLQDETTNVRGYASKKVPSRRHVLAEEPREEVGLVRVSLSELGYEGASGHLLLPEDTSVFATGKVGANFVHGGNSPQERIIPVLTVTRRRSESLGVTRYLVQAEPLPDILGLRRRRVRVGLAPAPQGNLGFVAASTITVSLRIPERPDIRVALKDAGGAGVLRNGQLEVTVGEAWTEVFFSLEGPRDERVRVEAFHPDSAERVSPCTPEAWFDVKGGAVAAGAAVEVPRASASDWQDAFGDEGTRKVFLHLEKHGAITELEATRFLGSPRAFRRFSLEFDAHARKLPFKVRIEAGAEGKRYVKEGER
ncbi:MAG TPA: BREX-6 system phosphatase PglZ [Myxococcaceae bacterium]|nr:BREX-6 system phosphatase PglZ [Myxococcaceae bacterium]